MHPADRVSAEVLFQPIAIGPLALSSRIAMAPMGRHFSTGGVPAAAYGDYYSSRAAAGVALITSEATPIPHPSAAHASTYSAYEGAALDAWRTIVASVHSKGGRFMQQLFHAGGLRQPGDPPNPLAASISPSGLFMPANGLGEPPQHIGSPATDEDLADVVAAFGRAAAAAREIGCDGVNIHGAHGYLLDQFLWPRLNRRSDTYGAARASAFAQAVLRECRGRAGPGLAVFMRLSQWKQQDYSARLWETPAALEAFLRPFVDLGVDLFDCSTRRFWEPEFEGSDLNLAGWVKRLSGRPTMTVGSVGLDRELLASSTSSPGAARTSAISPRAKPAGLDKLIQMLERGDFDLVAVGRALISNPRWAAHVRAGRWKRIRAFRREHLAELV